MLPSRSTKAGVWSRPLGSVMALQKKAGAVACLAYQQVTAPARSVQTRGCCGAPSVSPTSTTCCNPGRGDCIWVQQRWLECASNSDGRQGAAPESAGGVVTHGVRHVRLHRDSHMGPLLQSRKLRVLEAAG